MKVYTRRGDGGQTDLFGGQRVAKDHARVDAYGAVDELNAVIGVAAAASEQEDLRDACERIQGELFDLGADLATPHDPAPKWEALRIVDSQVERLESEIDWMNECQKPLDSFILPGGSPLSAHLHLARTVCRRAERDAIRAVEAGRELSPAALRYLNRLSDHLFVAARRANGHGADDVKWTPGATR